MKKTPFILLTLILSGIVSYFVAQSVIPDDFMPVKKQETALERVVRTNTLRCGYASWSPAVEKNLKTGEMQGIFVEMMEEAARMAKVKIDWVMEVDWGQIPQAINTNKIDAFCSAMWNDANRGKQLAYTRPLTYTDIHVMVRSDDERFHLDRPLKVSDINRADIKMAYTEGDVIETIKQTELPLTGGIPLPPMGSPADNVMYLKTRKSDIIVFPRVMVQDYSKKNPEEKDIRFIELYPPLRVYGNVVAVGIQEQELLNFLNSALTEFINSSSYSRIMEKYDAEYPRAFIPVEKEYTLK